jgi:hypothetical protein
MPVDKVSIEQFAQRIKEKYPQYKAVNDTDLVNKIVDKYPAYKDKIDFGGGQKTAQKAAPAQQATQPTPAFKPMTDIMAIPDGGYKPMMPVAVLLSM